MNPEAPETLTYRNLGKVFPLSPDKELHCAQSYILPVPNGESTEDSQPDRTFLRGAQESSKEAPTSTQGFRSTRTSPGQAAAHRMSPLAPHMQTESALETEPRSKALPGLFFPWRYKKGLKKA